ncbi:MAG: ABC transporter permease [Oscillospiraceae bacterium]|jgi:spermidine/putrescine transport system permease protein|nr:ABC transporter permease [Oscillospiraceae bacterium]
MRGKFSNAGERILAAIRKFLALIVMVGPTGFWLVLFVFVPLVFVVVISFMQRGDYGVEAGFSLQGYLSVFSALYGKTIGKSLLLALETTALCLLFGYPFAYCMTKAPKKMVSFLVLLIMMPFWVNSVIRIYAWRTLINDNGYLNMLLEALGLNTIHLMRTNGAILLGMVYELLPFAVLPLYNSLEKIDPSLLEAASDLGAKRHRPFLRVVLPLTMPGVFASTIQTFIPCLGLYYICNMMGGGTDLYIGQVIERQFLSEAHNWPFGSALSIILIVLTIVMMKQYTRIGSLEDMA